MFAACQRTFILWEFERLLGFEQFAVCGVLGEGSAEKFLVTDECDLTSEALPSLSI